MRRLILMAALLIPATTLAEDPQVIVIEPVGYEPPKPVQVAVMPVQEYEWSDADIDALASVYWAETGANCDKTTREKLAITQLVWNRVQHGSPFPATVCEVCKQRGEFNRGKISDRNRAIARANLNKVRSQADGIYQGLDQMDGLYMTREDGILTFQDLAWNTVYKVEG